MSEAPIERGRRPSWSPSRMPRSGSPGRFDSEQATRFEAALEALAPNTRRAYGSALAAWGRWAALGGVQALAPSPFALRAYLQERAADGVGISSLRLTVAALRKVQALIGVEPTAKRPGGDRYDKRAGAAGRGPAAGVRA